MNGLAYCAQEVISAVEEMKKPQSGPRLPGQAPPGRASNRNGSRPIWKRPRNRSAQPTCWIARGDRRPSGGDRGEVRTTLPNLEELEQSLSVLEEKLFAILLTSTPEDELLALRQQAVAELAPYRSRMPDQIRQVEQQFLHKRLLEKFNLPRLSLFYMSQG